ncbi:MAG: hypothetical protein ACJAQ4_000717 [Cryomorphaceae bacterium]|jgi:hypothetical protein
MKSEKGQNLEEEFARGDCINIYNVRIKYGFTKGKILEIKD